MRAVNMDLNLWVPYNMEYFLTSKKMLVSREELLHGVNCCQLQKLPLAEGVATYSEKEGVRKQDICVCLGV
jgi:hypothetical protein